MGLTPEKLNIIYIYLQKYIAEYRTRLKMAYAGNQRVQKVMVQPINLIFRYLQNRTRVSVWLYENVNTRIEGHIVGFDEYMNLVLEDAAEHHIKRQTKKEVGRIMLKGDNITLIQSLMEDRKTHLNKNRFSMNTRKFVNKFMCL